MTFDKNFLCKINKDLETGIVPAIVTHPSDNIDDLTNKLRQQVDTNVFVVNCAKLHSKNQLTNPSGLTDINPDTNWCAVYPNPEYLPAVTIKAAIEYASERPDEKHILALTGLNRNNPEAEEITDTCINIALKRTFDDTSIPKNLKIILAGHGAIIDFYILSDDELERTIVYKF